MLWSIRTFRAKPVRFIRTSDDNGKPLLIALSGSLRQTDAAHEVSLLGDPTVAAIASEDAAAAYGLEIIADDVGDRDAFTRFVAVAPYTRVDGGEGWRTALSFVTDHRPGALVRALEPFARHDLNLVQLVSRPLPESHFRYRFDVVLDGHVFDDDVRAALAEMRGLTRRLRLFGSYAAERAG